MPRLPTLREIVLMTALTACTGSCTQAPYDASKLLLHEQAAESFTARLYDTTHPTRLHSIYRFEVNTKQGDTFFGLDYDKDGIIDYPKDASWTRTQSHYNLLPKKLFR